MMTLVSFLNIDENELNSFHVSYSDIDECARKLDRCQEDASCTNTKGSYNCSCDAGYSGDGFNCTGKTAPLVNIFVSNFSGDL